jgi:hypothetical protein
MIKILSAILESFRGLNPLVTLATGGFSFAIAIITFLNEMWAILLAKLITLTLPAGVAASVMTGFGWFDYFFPVRETVAFLAAYLAVIGLCTLIRIIKSFIPTIN